MNYTPPKIKDEILAIRELNDINSGSDLVNAYGKGLVTPEAYKQHIKRLKPRKSYNALYLIALLFVFVVSCTREVGRIHFKKPNLFKHQK